MCDHSFVEETGTWIILHDVTREELDVYETTA